MPFNKGHKPDFFLGHQSWNVIHAEGGQAKQWEGMI